MTLHPLVWVVGGIIGLILANTLIQYLINNVVRPLVNVIGALAVILAIAWVLAATGVVSPANDTSSRPPAAAISGR